MNYCCLNAGEGEHTGCWLGETDLEQTWMKVERDPEQCLEESENG